MALKKNPPGKTTWQYSLMKILFCYSKGEESPVEWLHWAELGPWYLPKLKYCFKLCLLLSSSPIWFFLGKCCVLTPGLTCPSPILVLGLKEWGSWGCWHPLFSWENGRSHSNGSLHSVHSKTGWIILLSYLAKCNIYIFLYIYKYFFLPLQKALGPGMLLLR